MQSASFHSSISLLDSCKAREWQGPPQPAAAADSCPWRGAAQKAADGTSWPLQRLSAAAAAGRRPLPQAGRRSQRPRTVSGVFGRPRQPARSRAGCRLQPPAGRQQQRLSAVAAAAGRCCWPTVASRRPGGRPRPRMNQFFSPTKSHFFPIIDFLPSFSQ